MQLKPLNEQVVVVTGAGSVLGLAIARAAARAGAAVALADPDEATVRKAADTLTKAGARAYAIAGDSASEDGCQRIGRAAAARFDRIDGWVDATGGDGGLAYAAEGLVKHLAGRGGSGALVGFVRRMPRAARTPLREGRGILAPTLIGLPQERDSEAAIGAAAEAALYALVHPLGRMAVTEEGRLTVLTEASKHKGVALGVGLIALAGAAAWLGRRRIAAAVRPALARHGRPEVLGAVRRRPLLAGLIAAKRPREAAKLARLLR